MTNPFIELPLAILELLFLPLVAFFEALRDFVNVMGW